MEPSEHGVEGAWSTACAGMNGRGAWAVLGLSLLAGGLMIGSRLVMKLEPAEPVMILAALAPVPAFLAMVLVIVRVAKRQDELHTRIQLEALAATVIVSSTVVLVYGQFQKIGYLPPEDLAMAWPIIALAYPVCYALARRRYR